MLHGAYSIPYQSANVWCALLMSVRIKANKKGNLPGYHPVFLRTLRTYLILSLANQLQHTSCMEH